VSEQTMLANLATLANRKNCFIAFRGKATYTFTHLILVVSQVSQVSHDISVVFSLALLVGGAL
jgi:hypothetical protein